MSWMWQSNRWRSLYSMQDGLTMKDQPIIVLQNHNYNQPPLGKIFFVEDNKLILDPNWCLEPGFKLSINKKGHKTYELLELS